MTKEKQKKSAEIRQTPNFGRVNILIELDHKRLEGTLPCLVLDEELGTHGCVQTGKIGCEYSDPMNCSYYRVHVKPRLDVEVNVNVRYS